MKLLNVVDVLNLFIFVLGTVDGCFGERNHEMLKNVTIIAIIITYIIITTIMIMGMTF